MQIDLQALQTVTAILQSLVSTIGVIIGGWWVYRRFIRNREKFPSVAIAHQVIYKTLSPQKALLSVFVTLTNTGKVLIPLRLSELWIQQVLPLPDNILEIIDSSLDIREEMIKRLPEEARQFWRTEAPWPTIATFETNWEANEWDIEPNDKVQIRYDFFVERAVQTVRIYSFIENYIVGRLPVRTNKQHPITKRHKREKLASGWAHSTMHDLQPASQATKQTEANTRIMPLLSWINDRLITQKTGENRE